jgi:A/G-specific adenine glycosylase
MSTNIERLFDEFPPRLLDWYDEHKRDLPWRKGKNPYYTWVSEIMLQQTRVDTVIPYFQQFTKQFPTLEALADAPEDKVLKAWEGLGYYSRARNLHTAVKEVKERYGGIVPNTKEEISRLKGVGPYTAGAILSIAYNVPAAAVDGNVMRVFSRLFAIEDDIMKGSTRAHMEHLSENMIPHDRAGDFTQALMELGALVCTPKTPQCLLCPAMDVCEGRLQGIHTSLPVKKKSKPPRPVRLVAGIVYREDGRFLIRKRPAEGLLAGLWEVPNWEWEGTELPSSALEQKYYEQYGRKVEVTDMSLGIVEHTFSHLHWSVDLYKCRLSNKRENTPIDKKVESLGLQVLTLTEAEETAWVTPDEAGQYAFPNVFHKLLAKLK